MTGIPINRLKELRLKAGLTQEEVSLITGYDVTTISKQENGSRRLIEEAIAKYSKLYKVPSHQLFQEPIDDDEQIRECTRLL